MPDRSAYETLGGFLMAVLGRLPQVGDEIAIPGWVLRVVAMDGRRVERVLVIPKDTQLSDLADDLPGGETAQ